MYIDRHGDLRLLTQAGEVILRKPSVYQEFNGNRRAVEGSFQLQPIQKPKSKIQYQSVGLHLGSYDKTQLLVIDPVLAYSTYLGGSEAENAYAIAVDSSGSAYVTGYSQSTNFPTVTPLQPGLQSYGNAFIAKLNPAGSALVYSTYLGGSSGDAGNGIAVDSSGGAYVVGDTLSSNFPTVNAVQTTYGGPGTAYGDAFVARLNPEGSALVYSTYLGGSDGDSGRGIAVDTSGSAYVSGYTYSANFPVAAAFQPGYGGNADAFVAKLSPSGSPLIYSTYLGGGGLDYGMGIAVDSSGSAYIGGVTASTNFPTANAFQPTLNGGNNAFVTKLNPNGSALEYSTYLGGNGYEEGRGIAVDSSGSAYITGETQSSNFPTVNALQSVYRGTTNAFVTKLSVDGSTLAYSTYLGETASAYGVAIAVDSSGSAYVLGTVVGSGFPTVNAVQPGPNGIVNTFVSKLLPSGSALVYSSYLGGSGDDNATGISVDSSGSAYVTGFTASTNFPNASALQPAFGGNMDAFVAKIALWQWQPIDVTSGDDGKTRLLWRSGNGSLSLWSIDNSGSSTIAGPYGPYAGWTPRACAAGLNDGLVRILWTNSDGSAALWLMGPDGTYQASYGYGPYAGWRAIDLTVGSDNRARILWTKTDGSVALWSVDNNGSFTSSNAYGPYPGSLARSIAAGADGVTRVLWNKNDGTALLWEMNPDNTYQRSFNYGPYPGWTALDLAVGSDNQARLLWTHTNGSMATWSVDSTGNATYGPIYGPYDGWVANRITAGYGNNGLTKVLWNNLNGAAGLWLVGADGSYVSSSGYGPY